MSDIGVIVVDYQSDPLLRKALSALSASIKDFSVEVIVVENCPQTVAPKMPDNLIVHFIRHKENFGFGRAVNIARQKTKCKYLFLLNPDVQLLPNALSVLHHYMQAHPKVGLLVPKLLHKDGSVQLSSRTFYDLKTVFFRRTFLGNVFPNHPVLRKHLMKDWDHAVIREIDWALGACMLIRAEAVGEEIFDPRFFLYFEDVDLCFRLKKAGWKVVYHPEAIAIHQHRQRSRKHFFSRANFEHFKSWIKFMIKYKGLPRTN